MTCLVNYQLPQGAGKNNTQWSGGIHVNSHGYTEVYSPDHPFHDKNNRVREHRLIYEESRNCCLLPWVDIHHILNDGNKSNNVWYNLRPYSKSQHTISESYKHIKDMSDRFCHICGRNDTYDRDWRRADGKWICSRCGSKIWRNGLGKDYRRRNRDRINERRRELRRNEKPKVGIYRQKYPIIDNNCLPRRD